MINILNRTDYSEGIHAADSNTMRFWSTDFIIKEFDKLAEMGVETIRISDEMFLLNKKYYEPLCDLLAQRDYTKRLWTYTRIDTVNTKLLDKVRNAGIIYLAPGIESANQTIRLEITKGKFKNVNVRDVVKSIRDSGIYVIANYIFGFPDDTIETMNETLDLALDLNTEMANMYPCQALPGSPLYYQAIENGWKLPDSFEGYSFLSKETQPLPTKYLSSEQVLKFRDDAWHKYFTSPNYLALIEKTFGVKEKENIEKMSSIKLERNLLQ